jgi:hypothetical protein
MGLRDFFLPSLAPGLLEVARRYGDNYTKPSKWGGDIWNTSYLRYSHYLVLIIRSATRFCSFVELTFPPPIVQIRLKVGEIPYISVSGGSPFWEALVVFWSFVAWKRPNLWPQGRSPKYMLPFFAVFGLLCGYLQLKGIVDYADACKSLLR